MAETRKSKKDFRDDGPRGRAEAPNSRLFIVCNRNVTEEEFRNAFEPYGNIEEIWVVKDRNTGEPKGVTYVQFSKTSEAALAMEEMNGKCIGSHPRPLKVMIAHSRDEGSKRDSNEEERLLRLFCVVPKTHTDAVLREHFEQFGDIDYVSVVKDRETKESKGFAYVKYHRVSHAAKAFENCDRMYKAVFAEPKKPKPMADVYERFGASQRSSSYDSFPAFHPKGGSFPGADSSRALRIIASADLNQDQLWRLFDIIPGLDFLTLDPKSRVKGQALAVYNNPSAADYAREKLHGFEYPPGQRLIVKPEVSEGRPQSASRGRPPLGRDPFQRASPPLRAGAGGSPLGLGPDLQALAETIAQATNLIQAAGGLTSGVAGSGSVLSGQQSRDREAFDPAYCSVSLPPRQPLASVDTEPAERLFIVCNPSPPPLYALKDVFSRFGNLIDVYMIMGKNFGYAKYAVKECADEAMQTLHGQELCGSRLKVLPADPREDRRKRIKMDE
ncbi:RNA-binding protein 45 isoform X2 [Bacillus rossius redtenbacheri]|uniref:RNA-binding protein 45 isoform X2 n=1 Tax=Bacillus rossius redtenbacheri TaxID=93214 RepID=UPI002FDD34C5